MNTREGSMCERLFGGRRVQQICGAWFYHTREGTMEGPFATRELAQTSLEGYVKFAQCKLIDSASLARINSLSLQAA